MKFSWRENFIESVKFFYTVGAFYTE